MYFFRIDSDHVVYEATESTSKLVGHDVLEVNETLYRLVHEGIAHGISYKYLNGDLIIMSQDINSVRLSSLSELRNIYMSNLTLYTYNGLGTIIHVNQTDLQFMILASQLGKNTPFFLSSGEGLTLAQVNQLLQDMLNHRAQLNSMYLMYEKLITDAKTVADIEKHVVSFKKRIGAV